MATTRQVAFGSVAGGAWKPGRSKERNKKVGVSFHMEKYRQTVKARKHKELLDDAIKFSFEREA